MEYADELVLERIIAAEREAGQLMRDARELMIEVKGWAGDLVTDYDKRVQALLVERLSALLPDAAFFCEENNVQDSTSAPYVFIIDPIDGTMNFTRHLNASCVAVAYMVRGVLRAAAVYNPFTEELFSAVKDAGAFCNGKPIHTEDRPLAETIFCLGSAPYRPELADEVFDMARLAFDASLDLRRFGSAELDMCFVASGRAGLFFEPSLSLWDYAAGMLILHEAGGVCSTLDGAPLPFDGRKSSVLAGSRPAYNDFVELFRRL